MHSVKIAIIDNGIDELFLKKPLENNILVTKDGKCIPDSSSMTQVSFMHGTTCAMIIEKYFPECMLSSVKILNEDGTGVLTKLQPALEWCLQQQIKIVNLSLGSIHFKDKNLIRAVINQYSAQGMLIIGATSNSGYASYPASLSNIIGVAVDSHEYNDFAGNQHLGVDVLVPAEDELFINGEKTVVQKSNSYAAPYITALAGKLSLDVPFLNVCEIKRALQSVTEYHDIRLLPGYEEPDWIHTALVRTAGQGSNGGYYFNVADESIPGGAGQADTVIIDDLSALREGLFHHKNIVYLGNEKIDRPLTNRFFWSSGNRLDQIINSTDDAPVSELSIPIILCEWDEDIDEMFLLSELKQSFYWDDYQVYAISFQTESVLYDLEYIPLEALEGEYEAAFNRFLYWQTYYKQSDVLLFGLPQRLMLKSPALMQKSVRLQAKADLRITFGRRRTSFQASFLCEGKVVGKILFEKIDFPSIQIIFQKIKGILGEHGDEQ